MPINRRQKAFNNGTLIIEQLQRAEDAGTYTCMAQNKQKQTARRNVEVQVLSMNNSNCDQNSENVFKDGKQKIDIEFLHSSSAKNHANSIDDEHVERGNARCDLMPNIGG